MEVLLEKKKNDVKNDKQIDNRFEENNIFPKQPLIPMDLGGVTLRIPENLYEEFKKKFFKKSK